MSQKPKVITVKCPDVNVPVSFRGKRKRNSSLDDDDDDHARSNQSPLRGLSDREEFDKYMSEVKSLGNSTLIGEKGKKAKEDILTKLGVAPVKQQKMPFKMRLGINDGRKRRTENMLKRSKESGTIIARTLMQKATRKMDDRDRGERRRDELDSHVKGGVLHLSNKRVSSFQSAGNGAAKNKHRSKFKY
jgi:hypothetical protein